MNPYDFTSQLGRILDEKTLSCREQALTGFRLNKTTDGPRVGAAGELVADAYFKQLVIAGRISSFTYTGDQPMHDYEVLWHGRLFKIDVKTKLDVTRFCRHKSTSGNQPQLMSAVISIRR